MRSWFRSSTQESKQGQPSISASQAEQAAQELDNLKDALKSAAWILNDDIDGAEERLRKRDTVMHMLGLAVCTFMRAVLGFEKPVMAEANARLVECENSAWAAMKKAQKEAGSATPIGGRAYPPGSEYTVIVSLAQLMQAIIGVLHESLTEGIKSFYKLRKAYLALQEIMQMQEAYEKRVANEKAWHSVTSLKPEQPPVSGEDSDLEFVDADQSHSGMQTPLEYAGHLSYANDMAKKMGQMSLDGTNGKAGKRSSLGVLEDPSGVFKDPLDVFTYSGCSACFGVLTLIISMVPPAFSRLLAIIGFKGDREKGIKMLWDSTRFNNMNGAISGLMLLGYYHGLIGFSDILPSDEDARDGAIVGYPKERCAELLANMRAEYPESGLWKLEEGRTKAIGKDLRGAIDILKDNTESKMRQVVALNYFEMSLNTMYIGDYPLMRDGFTKCIELNDWSHALYYYLCGCATLEMYRDAYHAEKKDEEAIKKYKKQTEDYFRKAPSVAGKAKFMAKPLPFEAFVIKRLQKWEERTDEYNLDLADVVGVSPAQEMVYLWNGTKKMQKADLEGVESVLSWDRLTAGQGAVASICEEPDEKACRDICLAATYRHLGKYDEARKILDSVLSMDRNGFKGANRDDYAPPAAHYELAVLAWAQVQNSESHEKKEGDSDPSQVAADESFRRKKTDECQSWLETVSKWDSYLLDARFGMRVNTGMDTLRWYRRHQGWASS